MSMNFFLVFALTTLPAGISTIMLMINKKKLDAILIKHDRNYVSIRNSNNILKIIKAYKDCHHLEKNEKRLLVYSVIYLSIGYITVLTWITIFFFFSNFVLGE